MNKLKWATEHDIDRTCCYSNPVSYCWEKFNLLGVSISYRYVQDYLKIDMKPGLHLVIIRCVEFVLRVLCLAINIKGTRKESQFLRLLHWLVPVQITLIYFKKQVTEQIVLDIIWSNYNLVFMRFAWYLFHIEWVCCSGYSLADIQTLFQSVNCHKVSLLAFCYR